MKFIFAVLLIVTLSVSFAYKRKHDDDDDEDYDDGKNDDRTFVVKSNKAKQFLNRKKRHLSHECYKESCDFEEVEEHTSSRENALEYWYRYRCTRYRQYCYNGDWGTWSSWEKCSASCTNDANNGGIQRRHRSCISRYPLRCSGVSVQWRMCSPRPPDCDECLRNNGGCAQICVNTNGGYHCECLAHYYLANDKKTCKSCPAYILPRCLHAVCDNDGTNVQCTQCQGVLDCKGKTFQTYRAVNGKCEELCSWRYNWCYPGRCTTGPTSCLCLEGFSGYRCQKINKKPSVSPCTVRARKQGTHYKTASCDLPLTKMHLDFTPSAVNIEFSASLGVDLTSPHVDKNVPYILDAQVGLTDARITVYKLDSKGLTTTKLTYDAINCSGYLSSSKPHAEPVTCRLRIDAVELGELTEGNSIKVIIRVFSGGFITILNPESVSNFTEYYIPSNMTHSVTLIYDVTPPDHCSISRNCSIPLFDITPANVRSGHLLFALNGWEDSMDSNDELKYTYALFELAETFNGEMEEMLFPLEKGDSSMVHLDLNSYSNISSFSLIVSVFDQALNERRARAILFRFNNKRIGINTKNPIQVISADKETDFFWQKSLTHVKAVWDNHFYIDVNATVNVLPYDGVKNSYGVLIEGKASGITDQDKMTYSYALTLGKNTQQPPFEKFIRKGNDRGNSVNIPVSLRNGDVVTFWIRAENSVGQSLVDHAEVHVDTSPPIIDKVKLSRSENGLFTIENTIESPNVQLVFDVWDPQSGIQEVSWSLGEKRESDKLGYEKTIIEQEMGRTPPESSCVLTASICPRLNMKYSVTDVPELGKDGGKGLFFTIRATNHALMTSVHYYKIGGGTKPGK